MVLPMTQYLRTNDGPVWMRRILLPKEPTLRVSDVDRFGD